MTNLLVAREEWVRIADSGHRLDVIFVDFSKAFDRVPHEYLLSKLLAHGITGKVLDWLRDFLVGRSMTVRVNEASSETVTCGSGVPQGSVLGPVLFKVYVNDLPAVLGSNCLMYADDLKIWMKIRSDGDVDILQHSLDVLHAWSVRWQLPINHTKCSVLPVKSPCPAGVYHLGGYLLNEVECEKDLGVYVCSSLKTFADTSRKVASATRFFWAVRRSFEKLTPTIFRKVFVSHIRPILEYGQPAVYPITKGESLMLERVQRRGSKLVTGLWNMTYPERLAQLNMFSLGFRRVRGDLIYTWKILNGMLGEDVKGYFSIVSDSSTRGHRWKLFKPRRTEARPLYGSVLQGSEPMECSTSRGCWVYNGS